MTRLEELIAAYRNTMPCVKLNRTIFFDESNNFRKGVIGTEKDNNEDLENLYFTLGGIATKDPINFPELLDYIGAKQIPRDAKYKFFTLKHNGFTDALFLMAVAQTMVTAQIFIRKRYILVTLIFAIRKAFTFIVLSTRKLNWNQFLTIIKYN